MGLILRPLFDPVFNQVSLGIREFAMGLGRWHDFLLILGKDAEENLGFLRMLWIDRACGDGIGTDVQAEVGLLVLLVRAVAIEAIVGEDGQDLTGIGNIFLRGGKGKG